MFNKRALGRRGVLELVLAGCLCLAACSGKKDALVILDVQTASDVPTFTQFRFSVPGNTAVPTATVAATTADRTDFKFGYYMPVGGTVTVLGEALTDGNCVLGQGTQMVAGIVLGQLTPGVTTVSIAAVATPACPTDSGTSSGGGAGGDSDGGRGDTSGSGGISGSGGASDAGADVASTGGTGGVRGGGGAGVDAAPAGTGGSAAGGARVDDGGPGDAADAPADVSGLDAGGPGDASDVAGDTSGLDSGQQPGWSAVIRVGHDDEANQINNSGPQISISANGDAFVTFYDNNVIWARRYVRATDSWDTLFQISDAGSPGSNPKVATDDLGNAMVAWSDGALNGSIFARQFATSLGWSTGWGQIETIASGQNAAAVTTAAMTPLGHAVVSWTTYDSSVSPALYHVFFRVFEAGHGWDSIVDPSRSNATASDVRTVIAQLGQSLRVISPWADYNGSLNVHGVVYDYDTTLHQGSLGAAADLENDTNNVTIVGVAIDSSGSGSLLMSDGSAGNLLSNRYTGAWSGATAVNVTAYATQAALTANSSGDAIVTWLQDGTSVWSRRFTGGAWQPAAEIVPLQGPLYRNIGRHRRFWARSGDMGGRPCGSAVGIRC